MHNPDSGVTPGSHPPHPPLLVQYPREAVWPTWLSLDSHLGSSPKHSFLGPSPHYGIQISRARAWESEFLESSPQPHIAAMAGVPQPWFFTRCLPTWGISFLPAPLASSPSDCPHPRGETRGPCVHAQLGSSCLSTRLLPDPSPRTASPCQRGPG